MPKLFDKAKNDPHPMNFLEQITYNIGPGDHFQDAAEFTLSEPEVRVVAFYLPQFHPIPENDNWWGKGFTEWTNVTKAIPRFAGHYQPHLPGALGFYDLRLPDALRAQAKLAREFGIYGFCFHYYWFGGRKLLETPLNILLANPDINIGFCINWANESWSRGWNGSERAILIEQQYSEHDDLAFANALEPIVRDPRYIRINGRPLVMLYRPGVLPDAAATVRRWRQQFKLLGLGDPYIVMPQAFGDEDPHTFGMDAAVGFPPHRWWDLPVNNVAVRPFTNEFRGEVISYDAMVQSAVELDPRGYALFPGVCPNWDNDARNPNRGVCFVGSTPRKYGYWLEQACRKVLRRPNQDERLVFVNAWNEWAEGTHLEPDRHFGYAYLNETARVLSNLSTPRSELESARACPISDDATARWPTSNPTFQQWFWKIKKKLTRVVRKFGAVLR
jgi:lipopolysaccharide biosynthesis protein